MARSFLVLSVQFFLFGALLSCATSSDSPRSPEQVLADLNFQRGTELLLEGRNREAIGHFHKAEKADPDNPELAHQMGLAYLMIQNLRKAEFYLNKSMERDPKNSEYRNNLSRLYLEKKDYQRAILEAKRALEDPAFLGRDKSLTQIGIAHFHLNQMEEAKKNLAEAIQIKKANCLAQNYMGRVHFTQKNYKTAAKTLDFAVLLCSSQNFDEPHYFSAQSYLNLGQRKDAIVRFSEVKANYKKGRYAELAHSALQKLMREPIEP